MQITVNGTAVNCSHEVKQAANGRTEIHLTVQAGTITLTHVMKVGSDDEPIPANYDAAALQSDFTAFRQKHAEMAESYNRANQMANAIQ